MGIEMVHVHRRMIEKFSLNQSAYAPKKSNRSNRLNIEYAFCMPASMARIGTWCLVCFCQYHYAFAYCWKRKSTSVFLGMLEKLCGCKTIHIYVMVFFTHRTPFSWLICCCCRCCYFHWIFPSLSKINERNIKMDLNDDEAVDDSLRIYIIWVEWNSRSYHC